MTLVSSIITKAHRASNLIPLGTTPNANQIAEALDSLNTIVMSAVGNEIGDEVLDLNLGGTYDESSLCSEYVPSNARLVCNLNATKTLYLHPYPNEGQRLAVVDSINNLASYPLILNANGRDIEGGSTVTLNTNGIDRQWLYRADTANWVKISALASADVMPFPIEFDDYFIFILAIRLNPMYGQTLASEHFELFKRMRSQLRARYRNRNTIPRLELGLTFRGIRYFDDTDSFNNGHYRGIF